MVHPYRAIIEFIAIFSKLSCEEILRLTPIELEEQGFRVDWEEAFPDIDSYILLNTTLEQLLQREETYGDL